MIKIRTAIAEDLEIINHLFIDLVTYERENYDHNIKNDLVINSYFDLRIKDSNQIVLVAEYNNLIVGYAYSIIDYENNIKKELEGSIDSIFVLEEYRNKKIGTELIKETIKQLKAKGVKHIFITNIKENSKAGKLYDELGFKIYRENRKLL